MGKTKAPNTDRAAALARIGDALDAAETHAAEGNAHLAVPAVVSAVREMNALLDAIAPGEE
jgi:hypothetical protein